MKVITKVLGYGLLLFIAIPIVCRLALWVPPEWSAIGCVALAIGALWKGHTPESLAMTEDAFGALEDIGLKQDAVASMFGITSSQLSAWKVGREKPDVFRFLSLGSAYRAAWFTRMAKREGREVVEPGEVAGLLCELRAMVGVSTRKQVA